MRRTDRNAVPAARRSAIGAAASAAVAATVVAAAALAAPAPSSAAATVSYVASDEDFPNPERGFAGWAGDLAAPDPGPIAEQARLGHTLLRAIIRLDTHRSGRLPDDLLARLDAGFARVRANGVKVVLRFVYNFPESDPTARDADAPLPVVQQHLRQLAPVLARNRDVVAFLEAGFIGAWGEWHRSTAGLTAPDAQRAVRDALFDALPADRFVLFRYPATLQSWSPEPVPPARAFDGSAAARSGLHNDCFMSTPTDANTYPRPALRQYTIAQARVAPFGGETCEMRGQRLTCRDILAEGRAYALTYLNRYYATPTFLARWQAEGCAAEVARRFGYRFELAMARYPASARPGARWPLELAVRNVGWARLYNPRLLRVTLTHAATGAVVTLDADRADPRQWLPAADGSAPTVVDASVSLPADLAAGDWRVAVGLPDANPRIAADPRYAVRFANRDRPDSGQRWDAAAGSFELGVLLRIEGGAGGA
ncbi:MAG: DUF4832 domain-containing protein [Lautropia sp.]